jgi:hypothetical protein
MARTDILLYAEDPSAANYAALLLPAFAAQGWNARLYAAGVARDWLLARDVEFSETATDADAPALLRAVDPRCILTGTAENPTTLGLRLIDAARAAAIPTAAFVDALMGAAFRFRGSGADPLAHAPDRVLVPDGKTLETFVVLGYPREHLFVCGHPQYDQTRALAEQWAVAGGPAAMRQRLFPEIAHGRRVVVFVSEGVPRFGQLPRHALSDFGFQGRGLDRGRTRVILEEVLDAVAGLDERPYLVFRAHPTEPVEPYAEYGVEIDRISADGSPLELVYAADLVIGMTSMLLLEAALLGRPTLAVLARPAEAELLPSVRSGVTPFVLDRAALRAALPGLLHAADTPLASETETLLVSGAAGRVIGVLAGLVGEGCRESPRI